MMFQNFASQTLKKIIPMAVHKQLRLLNRYIASFRQLKKRQRLVFGVFLTDHCNLNCACCSALSPVADKAFYPVEVFKNDCLRLFQLGGDKISEITLAGGEPLLHSQITGFFDAARECFDKYGLNGGGGGALLL